jgi:hypothetical protein
MLTVMYRKSTLSCGVRLLQIWTHSSAANPRPSFFYRRCWVRRCLQRRQPPQRLSKPPLACHLRPTRPTRHSRYHPLRFHEIPRSPWALSQGSPSFLLSHSRYYVAAPCSAKRRRRVPVEGDALCRRLASPILRPWRRGILASFSPIVLTTMPDAMSPAPVSVFLNPRSIYRTPS